MRFAISLICLLALAAAVQPQVSVPYGMVFRAAAAPIAPHVIYDASKVGNNAYSGFLVDILHAILTSLDRNASLSIYQVTGGSGVVLPDGNWTGVTGELQQQRADVGLSLMTVTSARAPVVSFTAAYQEQGLQVVVRKSFRSNPLSFFDPFTPRLWGLVVAAIAGTSIAIYILDRLSPYGHARDQHLEPMERNTFTFSNTLNESVLNAVGNGGEAGRAWSVRIMWFAYFFIFLILLSSYTAMLAATFTVKAASDGVTSLDDLMQKKLRFGVPISPISAYFQNNRDARLQAMASYMNIYTDTNECLAKLRDGVISAMIQSDAIMKYSTSREPCDSLTVGGVFNPGTYALALPKDSPYLDELSKTLLSLREDGTIPALYNKWYVDSAECTDDSLSSATVLDASSVAGLFYGLLVFFGVALICVIVEWLVYRCTNKHPKSRCLKAFDSFCGRHPEYWPGQEEKKAAANATDSTSNDEAVNKRLNEMALTVESIARDTKASEAAMAALATEFRNWKGSKGSRDPARLFSNGSSYSIDFSSDGAAERSPRKVAVGKVGMTDTRSTSQ